MKIDIRADAASFYDFNPVTPNDLPFYQQRIASSQASVLELGCGTGRITLPLARTCHRVYGLDLSPAMIAICRAKIASESLPASKITVAEADITAFDLPEQFDWIIAPFRVFQNLESDAQVDGFFECVRKHLKPGGACILNVFNPNRDRQTMLREWCKETETLSWEVELLDGKITCSDRRPRLQPDPLVLYPELIYRKYQGERMIEEAVLKICMRCYYPAEFAALIEQHGFHIQQRWGGYHDEVYGEGPELVVQFRPAD